MNNMNNTNETILLCPPSAPPPLSPPSVGEWVSQAPIGFWVAFVFMIFFSLLGSIQACMTLHKIFCRRRRLPSETIAALSALSDRRLAEGLQQDDDL